MHVVVGGVLRWVQPQQKMFRYWAQGHVAVDFGLTVHPDRIAGRPRMIARNCTGVGKLTIQMLSESLINNTRPEIIQNNNNPSDPYQQSIDNWSRSRLVSKAHLTIINPCDLMPTTTNTSRRSFGHCQPRSGWNPCRVTNHQTIN